MRHFLYSVKLSDLVESIDTWGETSVKAENGVVYNCSEWQVIEELSKVNPNIWVAVLAQAFIVESINLSDLTHFVVTSQNC